MKLWRAELTVYVLAECAEKAQGVAHNNAHQEDTGNWSVEEARTVDREWEDALPYPPTDYHRKERTCKERLDRD